MQSARDRLRSRTGQALAEYAILLALAGGLVVVLAGFGIHVQSIYSAGNDILKSVATGDVVASGGCSGGAGGPSGGAGSGGNCAGSGGGGEGGLTGGADGGPGGGGGGGSSSGAGGSSSAGGGGS